MDKQNTYSKGDFCGHVAGPQGTKLLNKLISPDPGSRQDQGNQ